MTFVEVNDYGQDIFCYDVPADIDYIKFSDGTSENNRTDNISNAEFENNTGFYLEDKGAKYWPYATYEYVAKDPVETTAAATAAPTTVAATTAAPTTAAPTTAAPTEAPTDPVGITHRDPRACRGE